MDNINNNLPEKLKVEADPSRDFISSAYKKRKIEDSEPEDREAKRIKLSATSNIENTQPENPASATKDKLDPSFPAQRDEPRANNNNQIEPSIDDIKEPLPNLALPDVLRCAPKRKFVGSLKTLVYAVENESLERLCADWGILPMNQGLPMDLSSLPFASLVDDGNAIQLAEQLIEVLATVVANYKPQQIIEQDLFAEMRRIIATAVGQQIATNNSADLLKTLAKMIPDSLLLVNCWAFKSKLTNALEQDLMNRKLYSILFEPFFKSQGSCTLMPLPPPFTAYKRLSDLRAFVVKNGVEFIYFIHENSSNKGTMKFHKDLHKLIQLMRCALRLQISHLTPSDDNVRTLYCFGLLTSGYSVQLFQMKVHLTSVNAYATPIYELWAEPEVNLMSFDKDSLATLLTWLAGIRFYRHSLKKSLEAWQTTTTLPSVKFQTSKTPATSGQDNPIDDQSPSNANEIKEDKSEDEGPDPNNQTTGRDDSTVDSDTLNAIIHGINNNEHFLLQENVKYNKRVLLVCTTVKHVRLFVVKIYGAECDKMNEIDVLKVLGPHPNICQLLAVTKLATGELLAVQHLYENSDHWYNSYEQSNKFPLVFLQLAKGLSHVHDCGVIHGDIKPYNFMVDSDCNTRLIDFDFSARVDTDDIEKLGGTKGYYAPEWYEQHKVATGDGPLTFKIDIWSLAITICQYAGVDYGEATDPLERRKLILRELQRETFLLWPVRSLIERMLAICPNDRPTASEVFHELVKVYGDCEIFGNEG